MTDAPDTKKRTSAVAPLIAIGCSFVGIAFHFWAGWADESRIVLRPVGHWTVFALFAWVAAGLASIAALIFSTRYRHWSFLSLGFAVAGIALLFSR